MNSFDKSAGPTSAPSPFAATSRRQLLKGGAAALGVLAAPAIVRAQSGPKIRIGYWPIAAGLPFYSAVELGYFKEAGLNVEPLRFTRIARSPAPQPERVSA